MKSMTITQKSPLNDPNLIVNHKMVQVRLQEGIGYRVFITMEKGGVVETAPFPGNQMGLIGAMNIATEVMAGKIWLSHAVSEATGFKVPESVLLNAAQK